MAASRDGFEVFGEKGRWYWHLMRRGRIVADGAESYTRRGDALRAVNALAKWLKVGVTVREQ